jgi:outer membrane protein OmpA-like peptidoglycan-associated protein
LLQPTSALGICASTTSWGEVTVLFANGKVAIGPEYKPQLVALIQKAKTVDACVIQVKGYASSVGSAALNQRLSTERAEKSLQFNSCPVASDSSPPLSFVVK